MDEESKLADDASVVLASSAANKYKSAHEAVFGASEFKFRMPVFSIFPFIFLFLFFYIL